MKFETHRIIKILEDIITKDGSEHIPGERCVDGLVKGIAKGVLPVTDPNKLVAESAVKAAGRASALADAQTNCDKGECKNDGNKCKFVKMMEGSSVTSAPSRDPQGVIQWTATLVSFEVIGPCVCQEPKKDERDGNSEQNEIPDSPGGTSQTSHVTFDLSAILKDVKLEVPCANGRLQLRHVYPKCIDGTWHILEDDYYECPPDMRSQSFRVMDEDTGEPCTKPFPNPVGSIFKGLDTGCQSPNKIGEIVITECVSGCWEHSTYDLYQCLDGSKRIAIPATKIWRTTDPCSSDPKKPSTPTN
jgi:hypothetical protein